ncbi:hypothetical protein AUC71_05500 [Methyloceanibacter marginalis]|jgi:hypothetical protein|uniref:Uncharacterized protein n=1 Tax=Methyloceanibacter marginalis TaxID=1774971 RepID=A0A1E3WEB8_9HYPH|nr:hypothetical protein [Methyloceanibacter marginalis]ODS04144.1 hypothetical protein AUC71_05500 [Methyloceanibacter marginalis]
MSTKPYRPPEQSKAGQIFDSVFLLALVYVVLFAPLVLGLTGGGTTTKTVEQPTWEALGQNETMAAQWEKLGYTPESAAEIITTRFDYSINPLALIITALVIFGYFFFVIRFSDREYREVIDERFGRKK